MDDRFEHRAENIADQERKIQARIDAKASEGGGSASEAGRIDRHDRLGHRHSGQ